ncbi:MAG: CFI-box-CTERM domain-containing protein [Nitrosopumilus sp.]
MKTLAICSFFVLFAIVAGIGAITPVAFAEVTIVPVAGSGVSGCEDAGGCYIPMEATVDVGEKVIFSNTDSNPHTFTSGSASAATLDVFNSDLIKAGGSWTLDKELEEGEYPYFCMIHPWMDGLIIVQEAGAVEETVEEETMMEETVEEETMMEETVEEETMMEETEVIDETEGGGCLIATATFGSELAPQVQQLRELRDNTILSTESGTAFMTGFNQFYYSFSPAIADLEREQPIFKEVMKIALTPMLSSLSLLNYVDIDSEQEMLGYGISLILLNIGMYAGIPAFAILKLYQFRKN